MTIFKKPKWRGGNAQADRRAAKLKRRFEKVSEQAGGTWSKRPNYFKVKSAGDLLKHHRRAAALRQILMIIGLLLTLALVIQLGANYKGWTFSQTARHVVAFPNCDTARLLGLAPARHDQPGYYTKHDADNDGIACEPFPR